MSMLINAVSAAGNNSGICPLLIRDCGIEASSKVVQAYNQNAKESKVMAKHAARERIIDEYSTSLVWLGGIPAVESVFDKIASKMGFNPAVSYKLFENNKKKNADNQQSININIEKFKKTAPKETAELEKIKTQKKLFAKLTAAKYISAIAIPAAMMGFILPKANFALTSYLMDKDAQKGLLPDKYLKNKTTGKLDVISTAENIEVNYNNQYKKDNISSFTSLNSIKQKSNPTFKGTAAFMTGLTRQQKMAMTDGGLSIGRISTSRKKNEGIENGFRMAGMMYLNYSAPKKIEKGLNYCTDKIFGINSDLDPKLMTNKRFLAKVRSNNLELPDNKESVLDFLDKNPKSVFSKAASDFGGVKYLENNIRDPRAYVDTEKVYNLAVKMKNFGENARNSGNVSKYAKKAMKAKSFNILANIALSSSLLAAALPQAQYGLRRILFGSNIDPGLV